MRRLATILYYTIRAIAARGARPARYEWVKMIFLFTGPGIEHEALRMITLIKVEVLFL